MARDFDFRRTPTTKPIIKTPVTPAPVAQPPTQSVQPIKQSKNISWVAVVVILAVFAVGLGLYYQSLQSPKSNVQTNSENSVEQESEKKQLVVDVFDGGAGADVLSTTIATLKENGFTVTDSGKTQFEYDKTYIWYVTGFESDAQRIASLLSSRKTVLKESKVSGGFTVQIQLGKE
jgi:archaellum component FlaF (FlaF/FlaG flagellin family)